MRFINDNEIEVSPIQGFQIDVARKSMLAAQVGVAENGIGKTVVDEGIEQTVILRLINGPVLAEFFRAQDEHALVFQLEVFYDGQRLESFSQADAVGEDAAVVF